MHLRLDRLFLALHFFYDAAVRNLLCITAIYIMVLFVPEFAPHNMLITAVIEQTTG